MKVSCFALGSPLPVLCSWPQGGETHHSLPGTMKLPQTLDLFPELLTMHRTVWLICSCHHPTSTNWGCHIFQAKVCFLGFFVVAVAVFVLFLRLGGGPLIKRGSHFQMAWFQICGAQSGYSARHREYPHMTSKALVPKVLVDVCEWAGRCRQSRQMRLMLPLSGSLLYLSPGAGQPGECWPTPPRSWALSKFC